LRKFTKQQSHKAFRSLIFTSDGKFLAATSDDSTTSIWNTGDWSNIELLGHTEEVRDATFDSNGSHVATISMDGTTRVWETHTGKLVSNSPIDTGGSLIAKFNPKSHDLIAVSNSIVKVFPTFRDYNDAIKFALESAPRKLTSDERSALSLPTLDDKSCAR
jgi:WD40 repeat protein